MLAYRDSGTNLLQFKQMRDDAEALNFGCSLVNLSAGPPLISQRQPHDPLRHSEWISGL